MNRHEIKAKRVKHSKLLRIIEQKKAKTNNHCEINLFDFIYGKQTDSLVVSSKLVHKMYQFM